MANRSAVVLGRRTDARARRRDRAALRARRLPRDGDGTLGREDRGGARGSAGRGGRRRGGRRRRHRRGAVRRVVAAADRPDAPLEAAIFNAGGNWPRPFRDMDAEFLEEHVAGERARRASSSPRRRSTSCCRASAASSSSPAPRGRSAARRCSAASPRPRRRSARSRSRRRASSARRASTSRTSSSMAASTAIASTAFLPGLKDERGPDGLLDPDAHRRELLVALPAAAQRLDPRARPAAVGRDLVKPGAAVRPAATRVWRGR